MNYKYCVPLVCLCLIVTAESGSTKVTAAETDSWTDLVRNVDPGKNAVSGQWQKSGTELTVSAAAGSRLTLPYKPAAEYDFRVSFTRTSGVHSIALFFVTSAGQGSFEVDAWGQHLAGLQMINGQDLRQNKTRKEGQTLQNGRRYTALVEVRKDRIKAYLNDQLLAEHEINGSELSVPAVWRMPDTKALGIGAYEAATTFHSVEIRTVKGGTQLADAGKPERTQPAGSSKPRMRASATSNGNRKSGASSGKRVLLVIANQDFFYREYADPRAQLEQAGIQVEVAAGRRQVCRPHANSGQQGSGEVMPDLALSDVDPSRYDAIMFSGGWGSSMYQYAFRGSYRNAVYNGDRQTKQVVNRLLEQFVAQDKYVGALCHGVSVLAWARVNGKSLLDGKRAVGSPRQSPAGIYNGRSGQPLSRWNAETNGARLTPARSIGNPRTSEDDVAVDGRIITGEDDNSARLFGKTLADLLTK